MLVTAFKKVYAQGPGHRNFNAMEHCKINPWRKFSAQAIVGGSCNENLSQNVNLTQKIHKAPCTFLAPPRVHAHLPGASPMSFAPLWRCGNGLANGSVVGAIEGAVIEMGDLTIRDGPVCGTFIRA
jgi:hypothetical protein